MAAIDLSSIEYFLQKGRLFLLLFVSILSSCNAAKQGYDWASWIKDTDNPGIQYRSICTGKSFEGSKFTKWEVEVFNDYTQPLALSLVIVNEETGKENSERKTLAIPAASLRKAVFYNCTINCQQKAQVTFLEVQMLP